MAETLSAVKGMNDIAPPESDHWLWLERALQDVVTRYAYRNVRTPIVESTRLFVRGLGEVTDIVEKEMYSFEDRLNGEALTLRPEGTAGVVRAAVEHNWTYEGPKRLYYTGAMFRHERPQRGRYRQFHQFGVEALGFGGPDVDAEIVLMACDVWQKLGLQGIDLQINSLGQPSERALHRQALIDYLSAHMEQLDADAQRRLHANPLRILDTKNPQMQDLVNGAPRLMDYLGAESLAHFEGFKSILDANGVSYTINPRLVRGMDYYNLSVFEFVTTELGAQGTVCAGGRYDGLFEQVGGKPTPAVGWALGMERLLELLKTQDRLPAPEAPDCYAIVPALAHSGAVALACRTLRAVGARVQLHATAGEGQGSMKSQFKKANASGARWALVFGEEELAQNTVTVKDLRSTETDGANQKTIPMPQLAAWWQSQT